MLSNYISETIRTIRLVVYQIKLPSGMEVAALMLEDNAKQGVLNIFKSIFNGYHCSPMIRIISDTKLPYVDAVQYQAVLYDYFDQQKYRFGSYHWYGKEDAYCVDAKVMSKAVTGLINGHMPTQLYELPDELSF
jgi:hypothetical protein